MKVNAQFRDRAGLQSYAIRDCSAKCCDWCADVSGKYPANETPQGFWGRHDNCKCSILYESKRSGRQLLRGTSKKWEVVAPDAGAGELVRLTAEQAAAAGAPNPTIFTAETAPIKSNLTVISPEQAKVLQSRSLTNGSNRGKMETGEFKPATQKEIQQFVKQMKSLGFASVTGFERFSERSSLLHEISEDFRILHRDFPEVFAALHLNFEQTKTLGENAYAEYDPVLRRITLNPFFYNDLDFMKKKYESDLLDNFHPKGTTYRANIPHEFGHAVTDYYGIKEKQLAKQIYSETHEMHFTRKLGDDWIISGLCTYASEFHYGEIVSESFAEYYSSANPRDLCKKIVDFCLGERVK